MTSTVGYDIWSEEVIETPNYPTSTNKGKHFKPQSNYQAPTNRKRHFKPQSNNLIPTNKGRHFKPQSNDLIPTNEKRHVKPQDTDLNVPTKISHITRGGRHFKPPHLETDNPIEACLEQSHPTNTH